MHIKDIFIFLLSVYAFLWLCIAGLTVYCIAVHKIKGYLNAIKRAF